MMDTSTEKTSEEIQREIEADRQRIGERIDAIQERMSPGQLVDEILTYAKGSGGAEYVNNLGRALKTNPLPVALMGISLAWLMAKQGDGSSPTTDVAASQDYPLYTVEGPVRRLGPPEGENGARYSHFADSSGRRLRAATDDRGHRAGHFMDEAGRTYRGLADAGGRQIQHVVDETGAVMDSAAGWVSHSWAQVKETASHAGASVSSMAGSAGTTVRDRTVEMNEAILRHFRDQPLVGGALAFAAGAAIGAALPSTESEDAMLGESAESARRAASAKASEMLEQGKELAAETLEKTVAVASDIHDTARERVADEFESPRQDGRGKQSL